jgi:DNA gyrase subunit A
MALRNDDLVVSAKVVTDDDEAILVTQRGQAIRFKVKNLRTASRTSGGVHGIRLSDDCVVGIDAIFTTMSNEATKQPPFSLERERQGKDDYTATHILTVTHNGFGKLTPAKNYPIHNRGGKGVRACRISRKTGNVATFKVISQQSFLIILSAKGNIVCIPMKQVSVQSRNGGGVHLITLDEDDKVVSIATFD